MRLLILGASGGCGVWATKLASERGHEVRALVRESARFEPPRGVEVRRVTELGRETLAGAVEGVEGVVSCLGLRRRNPRNPWSKVTSPHTLTEDVTRAVVEAMRGGGVERLVAISAGGVGDSAERTHPVNRWLFRSSNIAISYRDLEGMERALRESGLDWHAVRPTTLTNGRPTGGAAPVERYGLLTTVRRADVASWMLDVIEGDESKGGNRTPMIAARR